LQPAAEAVEEIIHRTGVAAGLRRHALDDRKQIFRAMADLAQQGAQGLLAPLLLGCFDNCGNDPTDRPVGSHVGVDPNVEPARAIVIRDADFKAFRLAGFENVALGSRHPPGFRFRQKIVVAHSPWIAWRPVSGNVPGPDNA
jgi:hypothetical protein